MTSQGTDPKYSKKELDAAMRHATDDWEDEAGIIRNQSIDKADAFAQTVTYSMIDRSKNPAAPPRYFGELPDPVPGPNGRFNWRANEGAYDYDNLRWKGTVPLTMAQRVMGRAASATSSSSTALVAVGGAGASTAGTLGGLFVRSAGRVAINGLVNIANASGHLFSYANLGAPQAQRPVTWDEMRALQFQQMQHQGEQGFTSALALMDDQAMQVRDEGQLALTDGRADEPPAFPDADPDYDYDPPSLIPSYQGTPGAQSKAFPSAPPPKAKAKAPRDRRSNLTANLSTGQRDQLRFQQQAMNFRAARDDMV